MLLVEKSVFLLFNSINILDQQSTHSLANFYICVKSKTLRLLNFCHIKVLFLIS